MLYSFSAKTLNHRMLTLKEFLAQLMIPFQNSLSTLVYVPPSSRHCLNQQSDKTDPPPYLQFYFLPRTVTTTPTHLPTSSSARREESSGLMVCCAFTLRLDQPSTLSSPHVEHNLSFLPGNSKPELLLRKTVPLPPHLLGPKNDRSTTRVWETQQLICTYEEVSTERGHPPLASLPVATM